MPWKPTNDFEEEIVNLQPHHDFIYAVLSEPQYSYPRPKAHTEYAANKKSESKEQAKANKSNRIMNAKLHVIQQVQRMANTKPLGEQPTLEDWDNDKKIEQETIGMMRYCGMGVSVEQPLNQKVTIASYPVENKIKLVQNGRRKVALYFDDNVFKLKEKVSDTSSGFESCNNSESHEFKNNPNDNSLASEIDGEASCNASFVSTSSLSLNSFSNAGDTSDSFSSASACKSTPSSQLRAQRMRQYEKLIEDTSLLSLDSSSNSHKDTFDSFATADEMSFWKPISEEDENIFHKQENWPGLSNKITLNNKNNDRSNINTPYSKEDSFKSDSTNVSSEACSSSSNQAKRINFLDRFIKPENCDSLNTSSTSNASTSTSPEPSTYATITKTSQSSPKHKKNANAFPDMIKDFQPFYTTRRMYALKRHVK
ncbi:dentin sialophosphoprotein [Calliphora vicina]|uniref:dentin sialophosphoprotein n=1 Tax=Calliphora vicina TaxID=7373 RepID=UPI00325BC3A3